MPLFHEDKERKIVPRWRTLIRTAVRGELLPLRVREEPREIAQEVLDLRKKEWLANRSITFAADFLSVAVSLGEGEQAMDAAEYILSAGEKVPSTLRNVAAGLKQKTMCDTKDHIVPATEFEERSREAIHNTRERVHREPRNAFLWVNL